MNVTSIFLFCLKYFIGPLLKWMNSVPTCIISVENVEVIEVGKL